jgi:hypothetical protein
LEKSIYSKIGQALKINCQKNAGRARLFMIMQSDIQTMHVLPEPFVQHSSVKFRFEKVMLAGFLIFANHNI